MKLCWLGWDGYGVSSIYKSMLKIIPCDLFLVGTINGQYNIDGAIYGHNALTKGMKCIGNYDVIFCDTYEFSIGHGQHIQPFVDIMPWHREEWQKIKARKILFDLESNTGGQEEWYLKNKNKFDFVYSSNSKISDKLNLLGFMPEEKELNEGKREIKCYFSGRCMWQKERQKIAEKVIAKGGVVDESFISTPEWLDTLNNSVSYYASISAPGTEPVMYGQKGKPYECAYYGARPIVEDTEYNKHFELAIIDKGDFEIEPLPARQLREWAMDYTWENLLKKFLHSEGI